VVLATSQQAAEKLLPEVLKSPAKVRSRSVTCMYFAAHQAPTKLPILYLDGHGEGPVNNACVLSNVSPYYAPEGQHLISASVIGTPAGEDLEFEVRRQLTRWFGVQVGDWRHLRTYRIQDAQPEDTQLRLIGAERPTELVPGLLRAGDYCEDVSINGALISGRKAAELIVEQMRHE
jgi:protoporphyrinogen oxidase